MSKTIVARWQEWSGKGLQHLVMKESAAEITIDAAVIGSEEEFPHAARFCILCDGAWRVKKVEACVIGDDRCIELTSDGAGHWRDGTGRALPHLDGAVDVDLPITPFTNTLPIRRLCLKTGQSADIRVAYIRLPEFTVEI